MANHEDLYRREADFLLRENMNKLKGMIDLICLGIFDTMEFEEKEEFLGKLQNNMDSLYQKLDASISKES